MGGSAISGELLLVIFNPASERACSINVSTAGGAASMTSEEGVNCARTCSSNDRSDCACSDRDVRRARLCESLLRCFLLTVLSASVLHWNGRHDNGIGGISTAADDIRGEDIDSSAGAPGDPDAHLRRRRAKWGPGLSCLGT